MVPSFDPQKRYSDIYATNLLRDQDNETHNQRKRPAEVSSSNTRAKRRFLSRRNVVSSIWIKDNADWSIENPDAYTHITKAFLDFTNGEKERLSNLQEAMSDPTHPTINYRRRFRLIQMMLEFLNPLLFESFSFKESHDNHEYLVHSDVAEISTLVSQIRQYQRHGHDNITSVRILRAQLCVRYDSCVAEKQKVLNAERFKRRANRGATNEKRLRAAGIVRREFEEEYGGVNFQSFKEDLAKGRVLKVISDKFGGEHILAFIPSHQIKVRLTMKKQPKNWRILDTLEPGE